MRVKHLHACHTSLLSFSPLPGAADDKFLEECKNLVTLELVFEDLPRDRHEPLKGLRRLLNGLDALETLRLEMDKERLWDSTVAFELTDVLPITNVWRNLRRFEVVYVRLQAKDIVELLQNHRMTLECVNLIELVLNVHYEADRGMEWRRIFGVLGELEKLEQGKVIGSGRDWVDANGEYSGNVVGWKLRTCGEREVALLTNLTKYLEGREE